LSAASAASAVIGWTPTLGLLVSSCTKCVDAGPPSTSELELEAGVHLRLQVQAGDEQQREHEVQEQRAAVALELLPLKQQQGLDALDVDGGHARIPRPVS